MHDDHNILSDNDMEDGESTPRWKLNLSERAQHSPIRKARRKDWIKLIYSCSLSPEGMLHGKREGEDGDKQMDGDDNFFLIRNGDTSEFAVLHSGKGHIEPESFKDGRAKKCWTQYASLHDRRRQ